MSHTEAKSLRPGVAQKRIIRALLARRGWVFGDVEALLGAQPGSLSKALQRGPLPSAAGDPRRSRPAVLTVDAVARMLGCTVADITDREEA
jgi:hypothetical protein